MIYLDFAATSWPKPQACIQAVEHFLTNISTSPIYSCHQQAKRGSCLIEQAREDVAWIVGINKSENLTFSLNATSALNRVFYGFLKRGDRVLTSYFEHCSVTRPLAKFRKDKRIKVEKIGNPETGLISPGDVEAALKGKPASLLVFSHASNVTGLIQPAEELIETAHRYGCPVMVDAAQTVGVLPIMAEKWEVDFLAFPGHKHLLGPQGVGGLYVAEPGKLDPLIVGSASQSDCSDEMPEMSPYRFEAGTPNGPGIAGLGASCRALRETGINEIRAEQIRLMKKIFTALKKMPCLKLYGPKDPKLQVGLISFNVNSMPPAKVGEFLDRNFDIMVRTGLCSSPWAHEQMGTMPDGVVRASIGYFTKEEDVDLLIEAVGMIAMERAEVGSCP